MAVTVVTKGFIEVWKGAEFISRHTVETKAIESALAHADEFGDGTYELRFPRKDLSRITKTVIPFIWQSQPALSFTQGTAKTVQLRGTYLFDPQSRIKTITVASGSLPSGCAINGTSVVYNGAGAAATSSFTLTASDGTYSQTSSSGSATIEAVATNSPPVWTVPENYQLPPFTTAGGTFDLDTIAFDAEGDPMAFSRTGGTAPGSVTVSDGVLTVPAGITASSYTVVVDLTAATGTAEQDWIARSTAPGVVWAHDFSNAAEFTNFHELEAASVAPNYTSYDPARLGGLESAVGPSGGLSTLSRVAVTLPGGAQGYAIQSTIPYGFTGYPGATADEFGAAGGGMNVYFADGSFAYWSGDKCKNEARVSTGYWKRPFSGLSSGNGLSAPDIGVQRGTVTGRTWDTSQKFQAGNWLKGYYGRADLYTGSAGSAASDWDGSEFWIQYRMKFSADRFGYAEGSTNPNYSTASGRVYNGRVYAPSGKGMWLLDTYGTNAAEFIVVSGLGYKSEHWPDGQSPFLMNTNFGQHELSEPVNSGNINPGGPYAACNFESNRGACWTWPVNEWVTVLLWIRPGTDAVNYGPADTYVRVWVAREGVTTYTPLYNPAGGTYWEWRDPSGGTPVGQFSMMKVGGYMNNTPSVKAFTQSYAQIIFKKGAGTTLTPNPETDGIPCPKA